MEDDKLHPTYARIQRELGPITEWTLGRVLSRRAEIGGDTPFLSYLPDGRSYTYGEFDRCTNDLANHFAQSGLRTGDHVAVLSSNNPEVVATYFALAKLGAVPVPINTAAIGSLLQYYINFTDCAAIVLQDTFARALTEVLKELPKLKKAFVLGEVAVARTQFADTTLETIAFPPLDVRSSVTAQLEVGFSDLACLLYTSGTTGPSKAIMVTHASACHWGAHAAQCRFLEDGDVEYVYLPLFHGNAFLVSIMCAVMFGSSIALIDRLSVSRFWSDVRRCGAARFNLIGVVATYLWSQPPSADDQNHRVKYCWATPAPPFIHEFEKRFGLRAITGFGLTDYCLAAQLHPDDPPEKVFTAGRVREGVQLRIVDDNDLDVPAGTVGEIVLRTNYEWGAPLGYYKMPDATLESRRNLWFHTGDRGFFDADGFLNFVERKKDSIRRRGENISVYEVECVIEKHPCVHVAAVYAVASENTEDEVVASIQLKSGAQTTARELADFCARNMSAFMVPRYLEFVSEMPLTGSQKIQKYKLKERATREFGRFWDQEAVVADAAPVEIARRNAR